MNRSLSAAIHSILLAAAAANALADQNVASAEDGPADEASGVQEVIVTGTRTAKSVDKIPGAVNVISLQDVSRSMTLTEDATAVLTRTVPGYSESSQATNTLGETLRGRVPLRMWDGIPQSTPLRDGSRNGTFTDLDAVGRIEVINGPSAVEGIGAAGGIINYIPKEATVEGTDVTLSTKFGSQFESDSDNWKVGAEVLHKSDAFDLVASASYYDRGITYDANGRRIGLSASSSLADTEQRNLYFKVGKNFGTDGQQRVTLSVSDFLNESKGNYHWEAGNRAIGLTDTAEPGPPLGTGGIPLVGTEFNDFEQVVVRYTHDDLFGGSFLADAYVADQAMRFPPDNGNDRQDPLIAPLGTLVDASEVASEKEGVRTSWTRPNLFTEGLELHIGVDLVKDETEQSLAFTDRVWVPPMNYESTAPYAQLSYDAGPVTVVGGFRREDGELSVDDYTTTFFRNRAFVDGGTLDYEENLKNFGAIWRVVDDWSVFASYSEGFTLPNIGIPLRNISVPGQSVEGILDLQAIISENREIGFNWRGARGSLGVSYYESESDSGGALAVDPATQDFILVRAPVEIEGLEVIASYRVTDTWRFNANYAQAEGRTTPPGQPNAALSIEQGVVNISPDKFNASVQWDFLPNGSAILGVTSIVGRTINEGLPQFEDTDGYTLYDLTVNYDTERFGAFSLGVENLTDKFYFLSFSQIDFFRNYFAGRGRTVSLTYRYNF
jgi:iron complex outermembrane receptor protein